MEKIKNLDNFEKDVVDQFEKTGMFFGVVCCADCAIQAVTFLIEKYPTCLTTARGIEDGAFIIMSHTIYETEKKK